MDQHTLTTIPLLTAWDFFGGRMSGMAQYFRGLQAQGDTLRFEQILYPARLGRRLPRHLAAISRQWSRLRHRRLRKTLRRMPWLLGGQQFIPLLSAKDLATSVAVVFDVLALDFPDPGVNLADRTRRDLAGLRVAQAIITISEYTRKRICTHFGIDSRRVTVVPCGVDTQRFRPQTPTERKRIRRQLELSADAFIVLYVGSEQPRKNLPSLVRGLGALAHARPELLFVKIGAPQSDAGHAAFDNVLGESGLRARTRTIGFVADDQLPGWYAAADLFAFPSIAEGFGLPLLEAMSCGLPVVTTDRCSIPEVAGNAAAVVTNPFVAEEWAYAVAAFMADPGLRAEYRERSLQRAGQFRWQDSRRTLLDFWRQHALPR